MHLLVVLRMIETVWMYEVRESKRCLHIQANPHKIRCHSYKAEQFSQVDSDFIECTNSAELLGLERMLDF